MNSVLSLLGRIGLSTIFIITGLQKIAGYAGTQQYMESVGVPGVLLPLVIALEVGGGLAVLTGTFTRWAALALAAFSLSAALLFHADFGDNAQAISFWKNVGLAGGFLALAAGTPGAYSIDAWLRRGARTAPATR